MAEDAGAADLISGGRLQLGISRGSPEQVIDGWRYFGYVPGEGENESDMARRHTEVLLDALRGEGLRNLTRSPCSPIRRDCCGLSHILKGWRENLVGRRFECDGKMGGNAGDEPAKFDAERR
jgi:alkanesulfonate monooxygenase SsuD/methylene tetrahydromethanopterin reductase-like flavin-dependent oxidoreductase (luciferase family)